MHKTKKYRQARRPDKLILAFALILPLMGCSHSQKISEMEGFNTLEEKLSDLPENWNNYKVEHDVISADWDHFDDPLLQSFIDTSLNDNLRINNGKLTLKRTQLASKLSRQQKRIQYAADFNYTSIWQETDSAIERFNVSVPLSYDVDLWGDIEARLLSTQLTEDSAKDALSGLRINIAALTVTIYADLVVQDTILEIRQQQLEQLQNQIALQNVKFMSGATTRLGLDQLRVEEQARLAAIQTLTSERQVTQQRLATLLGKAPQRFQIESMPFQTFTIPDISLDVPLSVLRNRFDIRDAERQLKQANLALHQRRTEFLPRLSIRHILSNSAGELSDFVSLENFTYQTILALSHRLFDDGDRAIRLEDAELSAQQADLSFLSTVLTALSDIQNLISQRENLGNQKAILERQVAAQANAARLIEARYEAGTSSAFDFIREQQNTLTLRERRVQLWRQDVALITSFYQNLAIEP